MKESLETSAGIKSYFIYFDGSTQIFCAKSGLTFEVPRSLNLILGMYSCPTFVYFLFQAKTVLSVMLKKYSVGYSGIMPAIKLIPFSHTSSHLH